MIFIIKISVIGLAYVGLPLARLCATKYPVIGYGVNMKRVNELNSGHDATIEVDENVLKAVLVDSSQNTTGLYCSSNLEDIKDFNYFITTIPTTVDKHNRPDLTTLFKASETVR